MENTTSLGGKVSLFHLPNDPSYEDVANRQNGPRDAFVNFCQNGLLSDYQDYAFLSEFRRNRNAGAIQAEILRRVAAMRPTIIFWHHLSEFPVDQLFMDRLRDSAPGALLVYHEGDAFGRYRKRISGQMRVMLANADLTFSIALGELAQLMRDSGAKDLRYLPHSYDERRFGKAWDYNQKRAFKISMIASRGTTRIPGIYAPGGRRRDALVRRLAARYRSDFALYGKGWNGLVSWRGAIPFDRQEDVTRSSLVSVNWDHYDHLPYYFSDRLPISLAAGVPHITSYHAGYEDMFGTCPGLYTARTVSELMTKIDWLLSKPRAELIEEGQASHEWVKTRLNANAVYRRALDICVEKIRHV